ncbi:hypothetical protein [Carnimonas bestiolae]|uniref:hypothetical protein n=1 Tax=Carnimonas bestiolae TaxID=3402172 RepID=UPI003EDBEE77
MKPNGVKATIGLCVATCLAIALAGCHGKDDDANSESSSGKAEHHATAPSRSESAPADSQPASQADTPANKAPAHQPEKNGLTAADCTRSQWKRINCTNKGNSCIEKQIDQMGKYQRCKNAGLLEK